MTPNNETLFVVLKATGMVVRFNCNAHGVFPLATHDMEQATSFDKEEDAIAKAKAGKMDPDYYEIKKRSEIQLAKEVGRM